MKRFLIGIGVVSVLVASAGPVPGKIIYLAPLTEVVKKVDRVVRGTFDPTTGKVRIKACYGFPYGQKELQVSNYSVLPQSMRDGAKSVDAFLFLQELDGRHYLVQTSSPSWIKPETAIKLVKEGEVLLGLSTDILGDLPYVWRREKMKVGELQNLLKRLSPKRPDPTSVPSLSGKDAEFFYGLLQPGIDFYARKLRRKPTGHQLARLIACLGNVVEEGSGLLQRRGIEALLILAKQRGPDQARREAVEARMTGLVRKVGGKVFVAPLLAEMDNSDVLANKRWAALVMKSVGGQGRERANRILLEIIRTKKSTLRCQAYFSLLNLGFKEEADSALKQKPVKD